MHQRVNNPDAPLQTILRTAYLTGLSQDSLRKGVRNGTIPHVRRGTTYYINVPAFLEMLNEESRMSVRG